MLLPLSPAPMLGYTRSLSLSSWLCPAFLSWQCHPPCPAHNPLSGSSEPSSHGCAACLVPLTILCLRAPSSLPTSSTMNPILTHNHRSPTMSWNANSVPSGWPWLAQATGSSTSTTATPWSPGKSSVSPPSPLPAPTHNQLPSNPTPRTSHPTPPRRLLPAPASARVGASVGTSPPTRSACPDGREREVVGFNPERATKLARPGKPSFLPFPSLPFPQTPFSLLPLRYKASPLSRAGLTFFLPPSCSTESLTRDTLARYSHRHPSPLRVLEARFDAQYCRSKLHHQLRWSPVRIRPPVAVECLLNLVVVSFSSYPWKVVLAWSLFG